MVGAVKSFDVGVLVWLARLDVPDGHAMGLGHCMNTSPKNSGPLSVRRTGRCALDAGRGDRGVHFGADEPAIEVVGDIEGPERAPTGQRIELDAWRSCWQPQSDRNIAHRFCLGYRFGHQSPSCGFRIPRAINTCRWRSRAFAMIVSNIAAVSASVSGGVSSSTTILSRQCLGCLFFKKNI